VPNHLGFTCTTRRLIGREIYRDAIYLLATKGETIETIFVMRVLSIFRLPQDPTPPERPGAKPVKSIYAFLGVHEEIPFDWGRIVSSPYIPPFWLGLIRYLFAIYGLVSFSAYFNILVNQKTRFLRKQGWKLFGDIMFQSYLALASYFVISAILTLVSAMKKMYPGRTWPRCLKLAYILLQTSVLTLPLFCTIVYVYWTLPALPAWNTKPLTCWSTITFYFLNTVFSFVELILGASRPRPWSHLIVIIITLGLYLAFHSILVAATGGKVWIYTALKFSLPINQGYISAVRVSGLCIIASICFCVVQTLLWVKCRYLGGCRLHSRGREPPKMDENVHLEEII
jgi:hypothetical protein